MQMTFAVMETLEIMRENFFVSKPNKMATTTTRLVTELLVIAIALMLTHRWNAFPSPSTEG